jgi:hypothetical protein
MTGNGSPLDGIGRFSIVSLSFRVCAKANVGLMRAAPTPAASRKKLVRDKSLVSKDFELRRIVKRFLCTWSCCWDHDVLATAPDSWLCGDARGCDGSVGQELGAAIGLGALGEAAGWLHVAIFTNGSDPPFASTEAVGAFFDDPGSKLPTKAKNAPGGWVGMRE